MAPEWKPGGYEAFVWSSDGRGNLAAVWEGRDCFVGWVSGPVTGSLPRLISHHPTEGEAKDWCEAKMREEANDG